MTVLLELLTALLEYLDLLYGIYRFFLAANYKALLSSQNASIIPDSYTYLYILCSKLYASMHACIIASWPTKKDRFYKLCGSLTKGILSDISAL